VLRRIAAISLSRSSCIVKGQGRVHCLGQLIVPPATTSPEQFTTRSITIAKSPTPSHSLSPPTMPPRNKKPASTDPVTTGTSIPSRPTATSSTSTATPSIRSKQQLSLSRLGSATQELWNSYLANTPNSLLVIDAFLVFLMYVGGVQFVYACLTGGYPFNSFLAGFSQAVGQFVLTGMVPLERWCGCGFGFDVVLMVCCSGLLRFCLEGYLGLRI